MASSNIPAYLKSIGLGGLGGAGIGSSLGPLGALLGGILGAGGGALSQYASGTGEQGTQVPTVGGQGNSLTGYNASAQQFPRFAPDQQAGISQLLQRGLSNSNFDTIENNTINKFNRTIIPTLSERLYGRLGNSNSLSSPTFNRELGSAASDLSSNLAALRAQHGLQETQLGLQPTFENIYTRAQPGFAHNATNPEGFTQILTLLTQLLSNLGK